MYSKWLRFIGIVALVALLLPAAGTSARAQSNAAESGVLVVAVEPGSPAADAGIVRGDIILSVNGTPVAAANLFNRTIRRLSPGDEVTLEILHGDDVSEMTALLVEQSGRTYLGVTPHGSARVAPMAPAEAAPAAPRGSQRPARPGTIQSAVGSAPATPEAAPAQEGAGPDSAPVAPGGPHPLRPLRPGVDAPAPESAAPEATVKPSEEAAPEATVEPAEEAVPEATVEPAEETAPEATVERAEEAAPEATAEPAEEAASEATAEPAEEATGAITGAIIGEVVPASPAADAGFAPGDIITAVDGIAVDADHDLAMLIGQYAPGDEVPIAIVDPATGEEVTVMVVLGQHPDDATLPFLGVRYAPVPNMIPGTESRPRRNVPPVPSQRPTPAPRGARPIQPPVEPAIGGALITEVVADSPAANGGLKPGDIITAVDGTAVDADNDLATLIGQYAPGDDVAITIVDPAADDEMTIVVILGEHPDDTTLPYLGIRYLPVPEIAGDGVPPAVPFLRPQPAPDAPEGDSAPPTLDVTGTLIMEVLPDSPAATAGIAAGDVIVAVGDAAVDADNDLAAILGQYAPGDEVAITLFDPAMGDEMTVVVVLGENPDDATRPFLGVAYMPVPAEDDGAEILPFPPQEREQRRQRDHAQPKATPAPAEEAAPDMAPEDAESGDSDVEDSDAEDSDAEDSDVEDSDAEDSDIEDGDVEDGKGFTGAIIGVVVPDSPAADAGIEPGDLIVAVDGQEVSAENDLATIVGQSAPGDEVTLTLVDPVSGEEIAVPVTLGANPDDASRAYLGVRYMMAPHMHGDGMPFHHRFHHGTPDAPRE